MNEFISEKAIQLVHLYNEYSDVGTATASITSLDERGRDVIVIQKPDHGSSSTKTHFSLDKKLFLEYYELSENGCFVLFTMKEQYKILARKYSKAMKILED